MLLQTLLLLNKTLYYYVILLMPPFEELHYLEKINLKVQEHHNSNF
jgi:hypothetical protein